MGKKKTDRQLDVPGESNRDKHINFLAQERGEIDPATEPSGVPLSKSSSYRRKKEMDNPRTKRKPQ